MEMLSVFVIFRFRRNRVIVPGILFPTTIYRGDKMSSGKVMLGVVAGVAAGAVLGVLFAPAKGSTTRKSIARQGIDGAEDVQENLNEYVDATTEAYENIKKGAMDLVDKGKQKASSVAGAIRIR